MLALTFQVGHERVALDVRRIQEVVPRVQLTPASGRPSWVAGVFVYRGQVVPVVDMHRMTGAGECPTHLSSRIIIVPVPAGSGNLIGLLATQVADIREIPKTDSPSLASPTAGLGPPMADGTAILRVLDPDRLLANTDLVAIAPASGAGP